MSNLSYVHTIKDFLFEIKDLKSNKTIKLGMNSVIEAEFSFNEFIILSYFVAFDTAGISSALNQSQNVRYKTFFLDLSEKYYRREFQIILTSNQDRQSSSRTIVFKGQDIISYILQKLYIAKSYKNKTLADIFKDIFNTYVKPNIDSEIKIDLDLSSSIIIENFNLTTQKSVLQTILEECSRQGLRLWQDKKEIKMKSYKELKPDSLETPNITFDNLHKKQENPFDIIEYKFVKGDDTFKIPKSQVIAYDKSNKTMKIMKQNLEDLGFDVPTEAQNNEGFEYIAQEYLHDDNIFADTYKSFLNNSRVDIVVPGFIDNIKIFNKYKLIFAASDNKNEIKEGSIKKSGEYILTNYVDKLTQGRFYITKMSLSRFKDTEN